MSPNWNDKRFFVWEVYFVSRTEKSNFVVSLLRLLSVVESSRLHQCRADYKDKWRASTARAVQLRHLCCSLMIGNRAMWSLYSQSQVFCYGKILKWWIWSKCQVSIFLNLTFQFWSLALFCSCSLDLYSVVMTVAKRTCTQCVGELAIWWVHCTKQVVLGHSQQLTVR